MDYRGRHDIFDPGRVRTYPLSVRSNKVTLDDLVRPEDVPGLDLSLPDEVVADIGRIADRIVESRGAGRPVVLFTGAHLIKNGLGPLLVELVRCGAVTLVAGNAATAIHDFELALIGQTSENVPNALDKGDFGMAYEFAYINAALAAGNKRGLGFGEALGRMICDQAFCDGVLGAVVRDGGPRRFAHPETSVLAACYDREVPCTVHAGIGTDVIDQHASFDGCAKGGCSGRDFLIYTQEVTKLAEGGVVLNIGTAVTGPEVLLKAVSMAANTGSAPCGILTADFDLRVHEAGQMTDEAAQCYYYRDQKSVVTRIPQAFAGEGLYIRANQKRSFPLLYAMISEKL